MRVVRRGASSRSSRLGTAAKGRDSAAADTESRDDAGEDVRESEGGSSLGSKEHGGNTKEHGSGEEGGGGEEDEEREAFKQSWGV